MADDIVQELHDWAYIVDESQGKATLVMLSGQVFAEAANEIERLRAAGDKLAAAVNDEHRPRFCEMDCPSRTAVEAWEEARRG